MASTHYSPPGGILKREFLDGYGLSVSAAAIAMGMSRARLNEVVRGERNITADTALRLAKFFGNSAQFWMNLQTRYDLAEAEAHAKKALKKIAPVSEISHPAGH